MPAFSVLPTVLIIAVIALFVFSLYMVLGGAAKRYGKLKGKISPEFLRDSRPSLLMWDAKRAFSDMSSELRRRAEMSSVGGRWSHSRGTIRSLSDRGSKWLAFVFNVRGGRGRIDIQASSVNFVLEYGDHVGTFKVDGATFGYINTIGEILDMDRRPIGRVGNQRSFTPMGLSYNTSVDIAGRTLAEVHYLSDFGERLWKAPALVQKTVTGMSKDETLWIIAVIAMRLYSYCRTSGSM
jgi:hypothetical protein